MEQGDDHHTGAHSPRFLPQTGWGHWRWIGAKWATPGSHLFNSYLLEVCSAASSVLGAGTPAQHHLPQVRWGTVWALDSRCPVEWDPSLPSWARCSRFREPGKSQVPTSQGCRGLCPRLPEYHDKRQRAHGRHSTTMVEWVGRVSQVQANDMHRLEGTTPNCTYLAVLLCNSWHIFSFKKLKHKHRIAIDHYLKSWPYLPSPEKAHLVNMMLIPPDNFNAFTNIYIFP